MNKLAVRDIINQMINFKPCQIKWRGNLKLDNFKNVILAGMGGSGLGAKMFLETQRDILSSLKGKANFQIIQDYSASQLIDKKSLVIIISYSGNTQETLNVFKEAKQKGSAIVAISSNGKLEKYSQKKEINFVKLDQFPSPRFSVIAQFEALLKIFSLLGIKTKKVNKTKIDLREILREGRKIAGRWRKFEIFPVYSFNDFYFLGYDLKIRLNEDTKVFSTFNLLPEAIHNEFLGFSSQRKRMKVIFVLKGKLSLLKKKHLDSVFHVFRKHRINFEILTVPRKLENYYNQVLLNTTISLSLASYLKINFLENNILKEIKQSFLF